MKEIELYKEHQPLAIIKRRELFKEIKREDLSDIDYQIFKASTKRQIKGTPQEGYVYNNEYEFTPTVITVGGPAKRLSGIERIVIPVDISGASEQYETNVVIMDYLPNGVKLVSSENNIVLLERSVTRPSSRSGLSGSTGCG